MGLSNKIVDEKKKQARLMYLEDDTKHDIHERDKSHLENALKSYLMVAAEFPKDFKVIECLQRGKLLAPEIIHQKIIKLLK
jgi:thymidylate kinase